MANWDANDMLALAETWQRGDISTVRDRRDGGDFANSLRAITAKALIMPCKTDLLRTSFSRFYPFDSEADWPVLTVPSPFIFSFIVLRAAIRRAVWHGVVMLRCMTAALRTDCV